MPQLRGSQLWGAYGVRNFMLPPRNLRVYLVNAAYVAGCLLKVKISTENQSGILPRKLTPKIKKSALPRPNIFDRNTHFLNHGHLSKLHHISTNNKTIHRSTTIPWTFDEGSTVSYSWNIPVDISFGRVVPWILGGVLIEEMIFWTPGNV